MFVDTHELLADVGFIHMESLQQFLILSVILLHVATAFGFITPFFVTFIQTVMMILFFRFRAHQA